MRFYLLAALIPLVAATAIPAEPRHHDLDMRGMLTERHNDGKKVDKPKIDFETWDPYNTTKCKKDFVKKCGKKHQTCSKPKFTVASVSAQYADGLSRHLRLCQGHLGRLGGLLVRCQSSHFGVPLLILLRYNDKCSKKQKKACKEKGKTCST